MTMEHLLGIMMIRAPKLGQVTQGTIFTCGYAERYKKAEVHGLTITARCDIANEKFPVLNYLPVVKISDWMHCDGCEIVQSRAFSQKRAEFMNDLKDKGIESSVLNSVSIKDVVKVLFENEAKNPKEKKRAQRVKSTGLELCQLSEFDLNNLSDRDWVIRNFEKITTNVIKELIQQKLNGYYFLQRIIPDSEMQGYVVLMREVGSLSPDEALGIARGMSKEEAPKSRGRIASLSFEVDNFAMPVGQLTSPGIEHVMQVFSHMFGRIGLEDPSMEMVEAMCARSYLRGEGLA